MSDRNEWISEAYRVLEEEAQAILALRIRLDPDVICDAVQLLLSCSGRVVATGMGKSGAVGRKFASTLASTGTPASFLHPSEGLHGDLGMLAPDDVLVAFSYSGETDELLAILPTVTRMGIPILAFTGRALSTLGRAASTVLDINVPKEACLFNLAPTTSTTVMLALSDAVAIAAMGARHFTIEEYAARHPAGSLGRRLLLRVQDIMRQGEAAAVVTEQTSLHDALFAITRAHAGAAIVVDSRGVAVGIVTDGDARRRLLDGIEYWERPVSQTMNINFGRIPFDIPAVESLRLLESFHPDPGISVGEAPVVDKEGRPLGMLTLKDLVKSGIA